MINFTEACHIGIEKIDNDHAQLFSIINETRDLIENQFIPDKYDYIKELILKLENYADEHFIREEAYMQKINHPELQLQKDQHNIFRDKIHTLSLINFDVSQAETLDELITFLLKWLYKHILSSDIMIGKLLPNNNSDIFTFTDKYLTKIDFIDKQHKKLFSIIAEAHKIIVNDFSPNKYNDISLVLKELKNYTKNHFSEEESYMEKINYPGLQQQKLEHNAFISRLVSVNLDNITENQQKELEELIDFLIKWLSYHILDKDLKIAE